MRWIAAVIVIVLLGAVVFIVARQVGPDGVTDTRPTLTFEDPEQGGGRITLEIVGYWPCLEDDVLVGVGDYDGDGWDAWRCHRLPYPPPENREALP